MALGTKRRERTAGIVEKIGLTVFIGAWADILVTHRLFLTLDITGVAVGLIFLLASVIVTPYE